MDNALVLIAEDEPEIGEILEAYFQREGFRTVRAADGDTAVQHHRMLSPDLVVLDVRMPKRDGISVLGEIRKTKDTPVIMATALGDDLEKLSALKIGADDYVVKPYNPLEVVARARAVLRRTTGRAANRHVLRVGPLEVDEAAHTACVVHHDAIVGLDLTLTEFKILAHMALSERRVYSRAELLDACLPRDGDALERTVDSHISKLRKKLEAAGLPGHLEGVRGVGYRLTPQ